MKRLDARKFDQLRPIIIEPNVNPYAEGSALIACGKTKLLVTASVDEEVPRWMENNSKGWITAEYGMLPRSTHTRMRREAGSGKQSGRTVEIQRLIGRSLRQAVSLEEIPGLSFRIDCDVLAADGGTRCAAITGGWVALVLAIQWCVKNKKLNQIPEINQIAAISIGAAENNLLLDLCYEEDSSTDFDLNLVFCGLDGLVEIQGTGENRAINYDEIAPIVALGKSSIETIFKAQTQAVR